MVKRLSVIRVACLIICILLSAVGTARADWGLGMFTSPITGGGTQVNLGTFSGCVDGQDLESIQIPDYNQPLAHILFRHEYGVNNWNSETAWYSADYRSPIPYGTEKTFDDIYVWANPSFEEDTIQIKWYWYIGQPDPNNWIMTLQLVDIPQGVSYSGPTSWTLKTSATKTPPQTLVELPVYVTDDGLQGYKLRLKATHLIPEPSGCAVIISSASLFWIAVKRRR